MGLRILITGGAGFVGSHLSDALLELGHQVRALDNLCPQVHGPAARRPAHLHPDVELQVGDVRDGRAVERALEGIDVVYHFAALVGVGQSMYQITRYTDVNELGTAVLMEALARRPVQRLVVASSMSIYGEGLYGGSQGVQAGRERSREQLERGDWEVRGPDGEPLTPLPTPEDKAPALPSVYALSKFEQERLCLLFGQAYRVPTVALRFFNVYGSRQAISNPYTRVLAIFAARLLNGQPPLIFEDGLQRRDFVSVHDVVTSCLRALEAPGAVGGVFNVGSGASYSIREIAGRLATAMNRPELSPQLSGTYRMGDIRHCFADISQARAVLGYHPQVTLETGLSELVAWLDGQRAVDRVIEAREELRARGLTLGGPHAETLAPPARNMDNAPSIGSSLSGPAASGAAVSGPAVSGLAASGPAASGSGASGSPVSGSSAASSAPTAATRPRLVRRSQRPVLITGGAGFIGANLANRLLESGRTVLLFDNLSRAGVERNVQWLTRTYGEKVQLERADVRDIGALQSAVRRSDQVFHLAAQVAVTTSLTHPIQDFEVNARGTLNLLESLRTLDRPVPLVYTSTSKVYGGLGDVTLELSGNRYQPVDPSIRTFGIGEGRAPDFHSPYGCSKGAADHYVLDYARTFGLPAVVFRMSCIYGPHQFGTEDQGWVAHFLNRALEGRPLTVYGDGRQVRDVLFIEDLVSAFLKAQAQIDALSGQAFNLGGGPANTLSLLELLEHLERLTGAAPGIASSDWRTGDQRYYVSDIRRFQHATGWSPRVGVREGVSRLYEWLLEARGAVSAAPHAAAPQTAASLAATPHAAASLAATPQAAASLAATPQTAAPLAATPQTAAPHTAAPRGATALTAAAGPVAAGRGGAR